jgi:hypothetical protein
MADDQSQRTYRASEPPVRGQAKAPSNDPLAELARLIGQTDPFGEYGRVAGRPTSPPPAEYPDWSNRPSYGDAADLDARQPASARRSSGDQFYSGRAAPFEQSTQPPASETGQDYGRQSYGNAPATGEDFYQSQDEARYAANQEEYQQDAYEQDAAQYGEEQYYEDAPPSRRRFAVMAIAGVCALAVVGTAGAFGYRALFGSSTANQPPPVIKADAGPTKVVPAAAGKDAQSSKLITERVNERGQSEKLVSREEQPIEKPATAVLSQPVQQSALGSGVVGSEPKKVRTIAIRPDQQADAMPQGAAAIAAAPPTRSPAQAPRAGAPAPRPSADNAIAEPEPSTNSNPPARGTQPVRQATPAPNVPLSLSPDASPARTQAPPSQTAAVAPQAAAPAPPASSSPGSGTFVQVSSQRSEGEAQAAYRSLQAKYPSQLNGRELSIQKADLGTKGTYYRAMIGPFASANEASEWCSSLKAAGGQCLVPRN